MKQNILTSIEYCHYDSTTDIKTTLTHTNTFECPLIGAIAPTAHKGIMFDDLHSDITFETFLEHAHSLNVQPDTIYNESAFSAYVQEAINAATSKGGFVEQEDNGRHWLVLEEKHYGQYKKFLLHYDKQGEKHFSCPAHVATSYLCKLGFFGDISLPVLYGEAIPTNCSRLISFLPAKYLGVESNARDLVNLIAPKLANQITWVLT